MLSRSTVSSFTYFFTKWGKTLCYLSHNFKVVPQVIIADFAPLQDSLSVSSTDRIQYEIPAFDAEQIFGASFIAEAGRKDSTLSETGSVSSANVFRSDSISSSSSDAEHTKAAAVVLSPPGDTFASSHEGVPTAGAEQSFNFDAAFPPISSPSNNTDTTSGTFSESQSFQAAFPSDSSFGSKADTTSANFAESQSFQAAFPDDLNFGGKVDKTAPSFTENGSFQAAFPDDSSFGSKADTTGVNFAESQSVQAAFPDDLNFGGKVDKTAPSFTEDGSFQAAFPDDSSFGSKADTTGANFAESQSVQATFPDNSDFGGKIDKTAPSFTENGSFQAAFPDDSSFGSKSDTTGTSFSEKQLFQATFPDSSNFGGEVDKTAASLTENESFQAVFPDDSSFGNKAGTTDANFAEKQAFQATFPDDSNFDGKEAKTAASFTETESLQAAFPDDSSFGSKSDTPAAAFTENQSPQAAFPASTSFDSKAEATAVSFSESEPFEASFPTVTSSDTKSSTPSGNLNGNQTFGVVFPSDSPITAADTVSGNTKENKPIAPAFPNISGAGVDAKKPPEPAFEAVFPDATSTSTDSIKSGSISENGSFEAAFPVIPGPNSGGSTNQSQGFDDAFNSLGDDSASTNQTSFQIPTFEGEYPPATLPKSNESNSQSEQSEGFEAAFNSTTSASVEAEVGQENQAVDAIVPASAGFQAAFPPLTSTAEASNSSTTTFETNFDDAFAPITTEEGGLKVFTESGLETSSGVDSAFENLEQPALKLGGNPEDLFASKDNDPFSTFGEDSNKKAPSGNDDPFAPSQATESKPSAVSQFDSTFGANTFVATPFEFKDSSQTAFRPDDSSSTVNPANLAGFAWDNAFGESSNTTGEKESESFSTIDISPTSATETNPDLAKPTEVVPSVAPAEMAPTDSSLAVTNKNLDNKSDNSLTKQDPFSEFQVDFDALKPATVNTPKISSGETSVPKSDETDEEQSQILKPTQIPTMSLTPVDVEVSQVVGRVPKLDANNETRPTDLNFSIETPKNKPERPLSPSAPPPLPPRPIVTPPSLPPRPQTSPSMSTGLPASETPPLPPLPKISHTKKLPPALPPRVDLTPKPEALGSFSGFDLFGTQSAVTASGNDNAWAAAWPVPDVKDSFQASKENGFSKPDSSKSDPFGDDFFATFDIDSKATTEVSSTPAASALALPDPFTSTGSTDPFGSEDLFSQSPFTSSKSVRSSSIKNTFSSGLSDSFSTVPGNDPFSDTSDPFAGRGDLSGDPFTYSPEKKDIKLEKVCFGGLWAMDRLVGR